MPDNHDKPEVIDRYADLYEFAPIGYFILSRDQFILGSNLTGAALMGVRREELINKKFNRFVFPEDAGLWDRYIANVFRLGTKQNCDLRLGRPDGFIFYVQITSIRVEFPAARGQMAESIARTMVTDITARKKSEEELKKAYEQLKDTELQLVRSEKLAAVGRFSNLVAHEVKNPLGIALGGLELMETKSLCAGKDASATLFTVKNAILRANAILESLLHYSQPADLKIEAAGASDVVEPVADMMKEKACSANIDIDVECARDMRISIDKDQMCKALANIINNSVEAMPKGGRIIVRARKAIEPDLSGKHMSCVIEVIDTGVGISQENMARVTEPFFTTKERGIGTGLGLFIAKKIVDNHNGKLLIKSAEGNGTTVKLVLPLAGTRVK